MSRTRHHRMHGHGWRDPAWYRRQHNRRFRARCNHLIRIGRYDVLPLLRGKFGYFW